MVCMSYSGTMLLIYIARRTGMSSSPCLKLLVLEHLLTYHLGWVPMKIVVKEALMMRRLGGRGVVVVAGLTLVKREVVVLVLATV